MKTKTMKNIFIAEVALSFIVFLMGKSFVPIATYVLALAILMKIFILDKEMKK
jgi:hypothetical protein